MNLTPDMKAKINEILDQREFLRTGKKIVDGETYRLTDAVLMTRCLKDNEAALGKMIADHFVTSNNNRLEVD